MIQVLRSSCNPIPPTSSSDRHSGSQMMDPVLKMSCSSSQHMFRKLTCSVWKWNVSCTNMLLWLLHKSNSYSELVPNMLQSLDLPRHQHQAEVLTQLSWKVFHPAKDITANVSRRMAGSRCRPTVVRCSAAAPYLATSSIARSLPSALAVDTAFPSR